MKKVIYLCDWCEKQAGIGEVPATWWASSRAFDCTKAEVLCDVCRLTYKKAVECAEEACKGGLDLKIAYGAKK